MRLSLPTNRLIAAAVIAGGAIGALGSASPVGATVPGTNGVIVSTKCEDGPASCSVQHIWAVDPATGGEHALTSDPAYVEDDPAISPDGSRVAFQRCPLSGTCRIAVVDIAGGSVTNLTSGTYDEDYPTFSPDGSKIVFSRSDPSSHLIVMDANGGNEHVLTSGAAWDSNTAWSPDGSTIAFARWDGTSNRIWSIPASGGSATPLSAGGSDYAPNFSPDGSKIVFQSASSIELMGSNGTGQHPLTSAPAGTHDGSPAFSPDGTQIVFEHSSLNAPRTSPLMLMNADGSNQHLLSGATERWFKSDWQPIPSAAAGGSGSSSPSTPAADTSAPRLTLAAPKKESIRKGHVYLFATSSKAVTGAAKGKVSLSKLAKSYRLRAASKTLSANSRTKITLKVPTKTLRAVRTAFAHDQRAKATVVVRVKDAVGNVTSKRLSIRLAR
jgi:dipeptidyl aminopeptidase/acylaminoacyl peptidase